MREQVDIRHWEAGSTWWLNYKSSMTVIIFASIYLKEIPKEMSFEVHNMLFITTKIRIAN